MHGRSGVRGEEPARGARRDRPTSKVVPLPSGPSPAAFSTYRTTRRGSAPTNRRPRHNVPVARRHAPAQQLLLGASITSCSKDISLLPALFPPTHELATPEKHRARWLVQIFQQRHRVRLGSLQLIQMLHHAPGRFRRFVVVSRRDGVAQVTGRNAGERVRGVSGGRGVVVVDEGSCGTAESRFGRGRRSGRGCLAPAGRTSSSLPE